MPCKRTHVVNESEVSWIEKSHGEKFHFRRRQLGRAAGSKNLGCSLFEIPPEKTAFLFHYHCGNEEAIYLLDGEGTLRLGEEKIPVSRGDYIALPARSLPHQLINTSKGILRYLCFSTMLEPDVTVYPDSHKLGIFAGSAPGGAEAERTLMKFIKDGPAVDYYDGEG